MIAYRGSEEKYTIPDGVKTIGESAFILCVGLEKILLPNTVTDIEEKAFYQCQNLKEIVMSDSVTHIGANAFDGIDFSSGDFDEFDGCYYLKDCLVGFNENFNGNIKEGTRLIADGALKEMQYYIDKTVESINVPASVEIIGELAFLQLTDDFKSINVAENNNNYCSVDGVLFNKDKTELIYYPCGKSDVSYTVPSSVTKLANCAFAECELENIYLPDNLQTIGDYAFEYGSLKSVDIPKSIKYLGKGAFVCTALESITIPKNITVIELATFEDCYNLKDVTILGDVTEISDYAFNRCENLSDIDIPDTVTSIGKCAFQRTGIKNVDLPNSLVNIGEYAFYLCDNLNEVNLPNNNIKIGNYAFLNCPSLLNIIIPAEISEIGEYSFGYNYDEDSEKYGEEPYQRVSGMKIQGYSGTTAETYAVDNNIEFVSLGEKPALIGDVNLDGVITIVDATQIQKYLVGIAGFNATQLECADTNRDGEVSIADATVIQKHLVGLLSISQS